LEYKYCEVAGNYAADFREIKWGELRSFGYRQGQASGCCRRSLSRRTLFHGCTHEVKEISAYRGGRPLLL